MSQQLFPIDGGVQKIETTTLENRLLVLSQQYITVNNLETRPTEWVPAGRPIYRRLPAVSETYQIDFFNIVPTPNTAVAAERQDIGYVYVPWGQNIDAAGSLNVGLSDSKQNLLIKGGAIVWKYGNTEILPAIVNLENIGVVSGQYEVAYELLYDDSPVPKLYEMSDFSLAGQPLAITSSSDNVIGWRYPAVNAFLTESVNFWKNKDSYFPAYAQPTSSYLQWESEMAMAYKTITLRCPSNTAFTGTATLNYFDGTTYVPVKTVDIQKDSTGQYFEFTINPVFQTGWQIEFSSLDMAVEAITVSGVITLLEKQAAASTRAVLVMYPTGTLPKIVENASGEKVPATYCPLAIIDVNTTFQVTRVQDTRFIIHRNYVPLADWLTKPFDDDLIDLYEQVEDYPRLWLTPASCMKQEYLALQEDQIIVTG